MSGYVSRAAVAFLLSQGLFENGPSPRSLAERGGEKRNQALAAM